MILTDTPGNAFDKVAMDIVGPLQPTKAGHTTIQDLLTKLLVAIPLEQTITTHVADAFIKKFLFILGPPRAILTDQGSNLLSSFMRKVAHRFNITQYKTTAYQPQSNGSVERSYHSLIEYLKHFADNTNDWDSNLEMAMLSYNISIHEGTKYTPYQLVFGRTAHISTSEPSLEGESNITYVEYLTSLFNKLKHAQRAARDNLTMAKVKSKYYYAKKINPCIFNKDNYVYLLKQPQKGKLDNQYVGPFAILDKIGNHNVKLSIGKKRI